MRPILRTLYSVRKRSDTRSSTGERETSFIEKFTAWGEMPREALAQLANDPTFMRSEATYRMKFLYRADFAVGDQLVRSNSAQILYVTALSALDASSTLLLITARESPAVAL